MVINHNEVLLDRQSPEPLHLQLGRELRRLIRLLPPNKEVALLSERKLSQVLMLNRSTTHRTYAELREAGLLEPGPNKQLRIAPNARANMQTPFPSVGIVIPERFSDFIDRHGQRPLSYLKGVIDRASELNTSTMMLQLPPPDSSTDHAQDYMRNVVERLAGVIHMGDRGYRQDEPLRVLLERMDVPQVFISAFPLQKHIGCVIGDARTGAQSLCEQLIELGHSGVGIVSPLPTESGDGSGYCRYASYSRESDLLEMFARYQIACPPSWRMHGCVDVESTERAIALLRETGELPSVLWCYNDLTARQVFRALAKLGLSVPDDISVVGYDGIPASGSDTEFATIKLPCYALGAAAVDLLGDHYRNGVNEGNREVRLPTSLLLNGSLGKATRRATSVL